VTPEAVTSIITFVLNSALLSSFIIPQVQKLKEIKDQLFQFKLPSLSPPGTLMRAAIDSLVAPGKEVDQLQGILDIYRVRSAELKATVNKFYGSVILAAVALIMSFLWPSGRDVVLAVHPVLQLGLMLWALRCYSTDPDRLSSPLYLVRECDINPHLMIAAMGMRNVISSGLSLDRQQGWDDPLNISLMMNLRVFGFRFLFIISDAEGKVFYVSFGPITPKTQSWRQLVNPAWGMTEINSIEIGRFKFNQFATSKTLNCHLLVFLPFFEHEKLNPMLSTATVDIEGRGGNLVAAHGPMCKVESDSVYRGITFSGVGENVNDVDVVDLPKNNNPLINRVMRKVRAEFFRASKIESMTDANGLIAAE
jgi:hypothetical protein